MIKIPYGISNFETLVERGKLYIDRTDYIEKLEFFFSSYLFFVRPRRFGKSLFLSVLEYYYGIQYQDKFDQLFGEYYIGKNPTSLANKYLILKFDFSQIDTSSFENTFKAFLDNVKDGALTFLGLYEQFFEKEGIDKVENATHPAEVMQHLLRITKLKTPNHKIYLLVDEYDHFANEILSFRFQDFQEMVGQNGFVRKFYEALKVGTQSGIIARLFITGVSPLALDSLTSGFNIATNISLNKQFSSMLGFKQEEVRSILRGIEIQSNREEQTLKLMQAWYNGYRFGKDAPEAIYNSDMVLYFAGEYSLEHTYPEELLDTNIASDYTKIRRLFKIKNNETSHLGYLEELLTRGKINGKLVRQFELERKFDRDDFISLLYYTGILTIENSIFDELVFKIPNYVIKQLYFQYFHQILLERSELENPKIEIYQKIRHLALENDFNPLIDYTQNILQELSVKKKRNFDEKYLKVIFVSAFFNSGIYHIHSELEVKKSKNDKGFVDILLQKRPPFETKYQFVIELKYVKKEDADKAQKIEKEAVAQLKEYLDNDPFLKELDHLKAYVVVFVGNKGRCVLV